jgi:hypothetical protein
MDVSMRRTPSTALVESPEETVEVGGPSRAIETSQEGSVSKVEMD